MMLHVGNETLVNLFQNVLKLSSTKGLHIKILRWGLIFILRLISAPKIDRQDIPKLSDMQQ